MKDWLVPDWPAPSTVNAISTTRSGGVSSGRWQGLNLSFSVGDDPAHVAANRTRLATSLRRPAVLRWLTQVHGAHVTAAEDIRHGQQGDAVVAKTPFNACAVLHADCLPILLCNDDGSAVAAVHAGWRGLTGGVIENALGAVSDGESDSVMAWLGPAISGPHYEVGEDVRTAALSFRPDLEAALSANDRGRWQFDLVTAARVLLESAGVHQIYGGRWCTASDPDRFYSHRRENPTGRMATLIQICR